MDSPLQQFLITKIFDLNFAGYDLSFTNASLFMMIASALIMGLQWAGLQHQGLIPSRFQAGYEISYNFIAKMLRENAGQGSQKFFPLIFTVFVFVLFGNLLGLLPFGFTFTSHIVVTFFLSLSLFVLITTVGFVKHGWHFLSIFYPKGINPWLLPLIVPIEIIAYLIRPITLSIRLFANMLAGHVVLKLFGAFTVMMGLFGIAPFLLMVALTGFEFLIACLQAYVFTILMCIYLNNALHLH